MELKLNFFHISIWFQTVTHYSWFSGNDSKYKSFKEFPKNHQAFQESVLAQVESLKRWLKTPASFCWHNVSFIDIYLVILGIVWECWKIQNHENVNILTHVCLRSSIKIHRDASKISSSWKRRRWRPQMYTKEQKLPTMLMFSIIIQFSKLFVSRKDEIAKIFQSNFIISVWYKKNSI